MLQAGTNQGGLDLLSGGLDEAGIPLDDDDLAEQLLLLLFAGYETTASSLSCLFRALLLNPEVEHAGCAMGWRARRHHHGWTQRCWR